MATITAGPVTRRVPRGGIWRVGILAAALASAASVSIYVLARATGVTFVMPLTPGTVPALLSVAMVIVVSIAGAAVGTIAFVGLSRIAPDRRLLFPAIGIAFLLLSLGGPLSLQATDASTKLSLMLIHLGAGGSIILMLTMLGRRRGAAALEGDRSWQRS